MNISSLTLRTENLRISVLSLKHRLEMAIFRKQTRRDHDKHC